MKHGVHRRSGRLVTEAQQSFSFTRRTFALGAMQGAIGLLLAGRMAWLTLAQNDKYTALAESNRARSTLVPPRRGWIVDRHWPADRDQPLRFPRRSDPRSAARTRTPRSSCSSRSSVSRPRIWSGSHDNLAKAAGFQPVQVVEDLDYERFAARQPAPARSARRRAGARLLALLSGGRGGRASGRLCRLRLGPRITRQDHDPLLITPGFKIGKEGLEKTFEQYLRGKPGAKRAEVTARGKLVRELTTQPETPGHTLQLTIDAGLQDYVADGWAISRARRW